MARFLKNRDASKGMSPGSLVFIGNQKVEEHRIRLMDYDARDLLEKKLDVIDDAKHYLAPDTVSWINIDGLHHVDVIQDTGKCFDLHPLLLEDILNTGQRPKVEDFDTCLFMVFRMLRQDETKTRIISEQLSMVLGETYLLTFQEQPGDVFDPVRVRIRRPNSRVRLSGSDYLAYSLVDTLVDNYITIIEKLGEQIEDLGEEVLENPTPEIMEKISMYMREMVFLRKAIRPAREVVIQLIHGDFDLFKDSTEPFLKDLLDLFSEATESIDTYREILSDTMNLYNTAMGNKMNDIMKVLTIFAALFIPLTFVAGIYGTNFDNIPELHYKYGYFVFLGALVAMGAAMIIYFKRKKWL
jgi:magnesium transporter